VRRIVGWASALLVLLLAVQVRPVGAQTMDHMKYLFVMIDHLEHAPSFGERPVLLGGQAWYGGDFNRIWMKVDAHASTREREGDVEAQLLYSRLVSPWWDLQAGVRVDRTWGGEGRTRPHLAVAIQGLAPYWFEVESALFVDVDGHVSGTVAAAYDVLLTQSLMLEPELSVGWAAQEVPEWGIGAGIHDFEVGTRLRWEIRREIAPYVGYLWGRSFGATSDLRTAVGAPYRQGSFVLGVRAWY